jgi:hypothetical protein
LILFLTLRYGMFNHGHEQRSDSGVCSMSMVVERERSERLDNVEISSESLLN